MYHTLLQQLYVGKKVNAGAIDTRGKGTFYHGTREQFTLDKDKTVIERSVYNSFMLLGDVGGFTGFLGYLCTWTCQACI